MAAALRYTVWTIAGVVAGFLGLILLANWEGFQFYTIRSLVTGKTAMSEIVSHPADRWVVPVLYAVFLGGGAVAGVLIARRRRSRAQA